MAAETHPLDVVGLTVDSHSSASRSVGEPDAGLALDTMASAVIEAAGVRTDQSPFEFVTASDSPIAVRRMAAAALVRLLAVRADLFNPPRRGRLWALCDLTLSDAYRYAEIDPKSQTFEKELALRGMVETLDADIQRAIDAIAVGSDIKRAQQQLMKALNAPAGRQLLLPLLPDDLTGERLLELFRACRDLMNATPDRFVMAFDDAVAAVGSYINEADRWSSGLVRRVLRETAVRLSRVLEETYRASNLVAPATLHVEAIERRYPLSEKGAVVEIALTVVNSGPGTARGVRVVPMDVDGLDVKADVEVYVGTLAPGSIAVTIESAALGTGRGIVAGNLLWVHKNDLNESEEFYIELVPQDTEVDWDAFALKDPYALQPVAENVQLAGRSDVLVQLRRMLHSADMGSAYITGQKRVGKTSIAQTMKTLVEEADGAFFRIIYLEGGDFVAVDPETTAIELARRLQSFVLSSDPRLTHIPTGDLSIGLSSLSSTMDSVHVAAPDLRFVFILDEFDELPPQIYHRGGIGDAFFLALRALSGRRFVSFLLVGGEKMPLIMAAQGQALNRFQKHEVGSFNRSDQWEDFCELVRIPVSGELQFQDDGLEAIYEGSDGNPYFAKLICREVHARAVKRRDAVIDGREVARSIDEALRHSDQTNFAHFWEDGILDTAIRRERRSLARRSILMAVGNLMRLQSHVTRDSLQEMADRYGVASHVAEEEIANFIRRGVLREAESRLTVAVGMLGTWLRDYSTTEMVMSVSDPEAWDAQMEAEEQARVAPGEMREAIEGWPLYRGRRVTSDDVREWMAQFGDVLAQRRAFEFLKGIRFYGDELLADRFKVVHSRVCGHLEANGMDASTLRDRICVSHLDASTKSGATVARQYALVNGLSQHRAIDRSNLGAYLEKHQEIAAVVFVDDLIGTGESIRRGLGEVRKQVLSLLDRSMFVAVAAVAATQESLAMLEASSVVRQLSAIVAAGDVLGDEENAVGPGSRYFSTEAERKEARSLFLLLGEKLDARRPLGWGDLALGVVFSWNTPNNALPILWATKKSWMPLFKRN